MILSFHGAEAVLFLSGFNLAVLPCPLLRVAADR